MNRIYSLKYCPVTGGLIAVSELASRVIKKTCRRLTHILLAGIPAVCLSYPQISHASIVRADIAYQMYRDLLKTKGFLSLAPQIFRYMTKTENLWEDWIKPPCLISVAQRLMWR